MTISLDYVPCFLHDTAFHVDNANGGIVPDKIENVSDISGQGYGFFTNKLRTYLNDPMMVIDSRSSRRSVSNTVNSVTTVLHGKGDLEVHFDKSLVPVIAGTETFFYSVISDTETSQLLNLIEYGFLSVTDTMNNDLVSSTDVFGAYVDGSFSKSGTSATAKFMSTNAASPVSITVPEWIKFTVEIGSGNNKSQVTFKIWLKQSSYAIDYPATTIPDAGILYPGTEAQMKNPSTMTATASVAQVLSAMTSAMSASQYTGVMMVNVTHSNSTAVPFGIAYKGPEPSSDACYRRIGEKLSGGTEEGKAIWSVFYPSLFLFNKYYVIPFWTNRLAVQNSSTGTVYYDRGFIKHKVLADKMTALYGITLDNDIDTIDLLTMPGTNGRIPIIVFPNPDSDVLNGLPAFSTLSAFSTYTAASSIEGSAYNIQSAEAKLLGECLNAIAAKIRANDLNGFTTTIGATTIRISQTAETKDNATKQYFTFTIGDVQFYVLQTGSTNFGS